VPYKYLIDKRLVATGDSFWAIPAIISRRKMRRGYFSYPHFTQYNQQYMLPLTDSNYQEQRRKHHHPRHRHHRQ
jgi:hypothetical protein